MICPIHQDEKLIKADFQPPLGLDPKMAKYACQQCVEYWYKAPKCQFKRWWQLEQDLLIPPAFSLSPQTPHRRY